MTGGMDLETKSEIGRCYFHAEIAVKAAQLGMEAVRRHVLAVEDEGRFTAAIRLLDQAADAMQHLWFELEDHLQAEDGKPATDETQTLLFEGLSKYASPSFWWKKSGKISQAEADKGEFARSILEKISPDQGEGSDD
jgi:hypothetical protein